MDRGSPALRTALGWAATELVRAGVPPGDARLDARVLARHAFELDEAALILREPDPPDPKALQAFRAAVARRARLEPVAYIVGHREFYGREFSVSPAVLIPRPETELVVEMALARCADRATALEIVDVGTGSGCIAVTLACELPRARLVATDVSLAALEIARSNAQRHGVSDRIALQAVSLTPQVDRTDLIVSNPPYIPTGQRGALPRDVREYEPAQALFAGADGLEVIRDLVREAPRILTRGSGWLVFEFGYGQAADVERFLREDDRYDRIEFAADLQGIPRVAAAHRT